MKRTHPQNRRQREGGQGLPETPEPYLASLVLTDREGQVLELLGAGRSNREIADLLHVSIKDIEYHVGNLLRKWGCRNRTEAVSRAFTLGYLSSERWPPKMAPVRGVSGTTPRQRTRTRETPSER